MGVSLEGLAQVDGLSMVDIQKNTRVGCKVLARLVESLKKNVCQTQAI